LATSLIGRHVRDAEMRRAAANYFIHVMLLFSCERHQYVRIVPSI